MKLKTILFDLVFIVVLTALLIVLNETGKMSTLIKYPFITVYSAYILGRLVGILAGRHK
jgi:hypothetical protein